MVHTTYRPYRTYRSYRMELVDGKGIAGMMDLVNVTKAYTQGRRVVQAVRGVDLHINTGEFVSIMGPSGSGKSTLLHLLGALDTPSTGHVIFQGLNLQTMSDRQRSLLRRTRI